MKNILVTCAGVIVGIFISPFSIYIPFIFGWFCIAVFFFLDAFVGKNFFKVDAVHAYFVGWFCLGIFFGLCRVFVFNYFLPHGLEMWEGEKVSLKGTIITTSVSNGSTQKFTLDVFSINLKDIQGHVLVSATLFPQYQYGDVVQVRGTLKPPKKIDDGTGPIFNYPGYLRKDGVTETMGFASVTFIESNHGNVVIKYLYTIRNSFVRAVGKILPEPYAGLLSGIVFGTQTLAPTLTNNFRTAGLSHIVVLSGYNITIVAETLIALAVYITPGGASFFAVCGVALFTLMSGAGASAVRAGVMAVIALLGRRFGKTYNAGRALFFASFLMVIWNPLTLLYDPSFHLSFLATYAMIYVSPMTLKWFHRVPHYVGLQEILSTTCAVNVFVLPYILFMAGKLAVYSIPTNMIILPLVPLTMAIGLATAVFGFLPAPLYFIGYIPGIVSYGITRYDIFVAYIVSHLPYTQIAVNHFSLLLLISTYGTFGCLYVFVLKEEPMKLHVPSFLRLRTSSDF